MTNKDKYKKAFSTLHTSKEYIMEVSEMKEKSRALRLNKMVSVFTVFMVIVACSVTAYAADVGGIKSKVEAAISGEIQGIAIERMPQSNVSDLSNEEYEEYLKSDYKAKNKTHFISVKKRYTTKEAVPVAIFYSEYKKNCWWEGVLPRVNSVTIDSVTGHYLAIFEGELEKEDLKISIQIKK